MLSHCWSGSVQLSHVMSVCLQWTVVSIDTHHLRVRQRNFSPSMLWRCRFFCRARKSVLSEMTYTLSDGTLNSTQQQHAPYSLVSDMCYAIEYVQQLTHVMSVCLQLTVVSIDTHHFRVLQRNVRQNITDTTQCVCVCSWLVCICVHRMALF